MYMTGEAQVVAPYEVEDVVEPPDTQLVLSNLVILFLPFPVMIKMCRYSFFS